MWKRILIGLLYTSFISLLIFYFYFSNKINKEISNTEVCSKIEVRILDSLENKFLSPHDINNLLINSKSNPLHKKIDEIDLFSLEKILSHKSAIKKSDISINRKGLLKVDITQRRPVLRILSKNGGFYIDDEKYIFPLVKSFTSYVPIVSGHIPIKLKTGYRGSVNEKEKEWLDKIIEFGEYLDKNPFWNNMIQEIYISSNQDIFLYTRIGNQTINFGKINNLDKKFSKLDSFYHNIVPIYGWNKYKEVNLKFEDQIVCTKRHN